MDTFLSIVLKSANDDRLFDIYIWEKASDVQNLNKTI